MKATVARRRELWRQRVRPYEGKLSRYRRERNCELINYRTKQHLDAERLARNFFEPDPLWSRTAENYGPWPG